MNDSRLTLPSFAKVNWRLQVIGKRDDGYHDIFTIFQTISLCDELHFEHAGKLSLACDDASIPTGAENLIVQAAELLREEFSVDAGAAIRLTKRIPAPGGLGGGSSNAAVALVGLCRLWAIRPDREALLRLANLLGSDVPFFLVGGTAIGTGRGTEIEPIADIEEPLMLTVTPRIAVSTADAFRRLNSKRLTIEESKSILEICRKDAQGFGTRHSDLKNDFEASVFELHPEIRGLKGRLMKHGANGALLSGSGASVFAIFDKKETRQATLEALGNETDWRAFAVSTVNRADYAKAIGLKAVVSD